MMNGSDNNMAGYGGLKSAVHPETPDPGRNEIRAVFTDSTIRVYQAYNRIIADEAVRCGTFGEHFSMNRMTWIKPSFLWMMYRCGWAQKENQERVLAIDIKREGFEKAVRSAVLSSYSEEIGSDSRGLNGLGNGAQDGEGANAGLTKAEWQMMVQKSDVRVQWDPEKDVSGNNLPYRSIQIGLRGEALREYVNDWIVAVTDITDLVHDLDARRQKGEDIRSLLPKEEVYPWQ